MINDMLKDHMVPDHLLMELEPRLLEYVIFKGNAWYTQRGEHFSGFGDKLLNLLIRTSDLAKAEPETLWSVRTVGGRIVYLVKNGLPVEF